MISLLGRDLSVITEFVSLFYTQKVNNKLSDPLQKVGFRICHKVGKQSALFPVFSKD